MATDTRQGTLKIDTDFTPQPFHDA
jgi:hypothetical protein